ncbi:chlorohydrolase [Streptococcus pneumoniae]|uniref:hypothetical protein n=1 Tax=Streptococcus pneumoniae TaxID=1313 RepID=UPI000B6D4B8F|nr:hypothetical protein [Streptococcus pneumoniae]SND20138.1 chlorohydrolase [Streptococcus pneumoniae]
MKIKEQTRKLAAGCSKQCFEKDSLKHCFEVVDELTKSAQKKLAAGCSKHCFEVADGS